MARKYTLTQAAIEQRRKAGRIGGSKTSWRKRLTARRNGKLGGRPSQ